MIENGGLLERKWIRGLDMILSMIFIYGRTSVFSPFVFFFIFDAMSAGSKENEQALYVETLSIINFFCTLWD